MWSWRSVVTAGVIIMSDIECHPHSHQYSLSLWEVWQAGEVLRRSKKNQKREVYKADAIWNLIYSVPSLKVQPERVCPFKTVWVKEGEQCHLGRVLSAVILERKETAENRKEQKYSSWTSQQDCKNLQEREPGKIINGMSSIALSHSRGLLSSYLRTNGLAPALPQKAESLAASLLVLICSSHIP